MDLCINRCFSLQAVQQWWNEANFLPQDCRVIVLQPRKLTVGSGLRLDPALSLLFSRTVSPHSPGPCERQQQHWP